MTGLLNLEWTSSLKSSKQGLGTSWWSKSQCLPAGSALYSFPAPIVRVEALESVLRFSELFMECQTEVTNKEKTCLYQLWLKLKFTVQNPSVTFGPGEVLLRIIILLEIRMN